MRVYLSRHRLVLAAGLLGLAVLAVFRGRGSSLSQATAEPPVPQQAAPQPPGVAPPAASTSDYSRRVVAYIYDTVPITREDLGEYLIARMEPDRLSNMVNRRIIEYACQQKGIEVTAAEVEADFTETLHGLNNLTEKDFVKKILLPYKKTLYEWKEDVIRPRLLLAKLCQDRVQVTEEDLRLAYEAYYGEHVECRLIMWPAKEESLVLNTVYAKIRDSEEEFERVAKQQASPSLAASGGRIKPLGRHTTGNDELEKAAFALKPGELSRVIGTPEGVVVLKCDKRLPPRTEVKLEGKVRDDLTKEVHDKKIQLEIPKIFAQLREQARPVEFIKGNLTEDELKRQVQRELQTPGSKSGSAVHSPLQGN